MAASVTMGASATAGSGTDASGTEDSAIIAASTTAASGSGSVGLAGGILPALISSLRITVTAAQSSVRCLEVTSASAADCNPAAGPSSLRYENGRRCVLGDGREIASVAQLFFTMADPVLARQPQLVTKAGSGDEMHDAIASKSSRAMIQGSTGLEKFAKQEGRQ